MNESDSTAETAAESPLAGGSSWRRAGTTLVIAVALWAVAIASGAAVAALGGTGTGQTASAWTAPTITVGSAVVDRSPEAVRKWAIRQFGTNDKRALAIGTAVLLAVIAVVAANDVIRHRPRRAAGLIAITGVVGMLAALTGRGAIVPALVPVLGSTVCTIGFLWWLTRAGPVAATDQSPTRRTLMLSGGATAAAAFLGWGAGAATRRVVATRHRTATALPKPQTPLPDPKVVAPPVEVSPYFVPNSAFYRIDTALSVPTIDASTWSMKVDGMVDTKLHLTYDELLARPMIEVDCTIACVSNDVGGDLVGNARWLGCRLDDLLKEAGITAGADQVMGRSVDGFTAGFPTTVLDGRDAIVAVGMNGEVLPFEHGFPARLIVPGVYGYVSATKWLAAISLTTFEAEQGYWIPRGWDVLAPVKVASRIDTPRNGDRLKAGAGFIGGVAWAPIDGIAKVEVKVDDGAWKVATLGTESSDASWRQWWIPWDRTAGQHVIEVRATNKKGELQPSDEVPAGPNAATGWHTIDVEVG